jgi:hypothetical protein
MATLLIGGSLSQNRKDVEHMTKSDMHGLLATMLIVVGLLLGVLSFGGLATAFDFHLDTAHGNSYGVNRSGTTYATGDCAHCHDTFDTDICGQEGHPRILLADNDNDFCLKCHDNTTEPSNRTIVNRSYSYRAGGWTDDTLDDIREAFDSTSKHNLGDVKTFIDGKWGYTADSNPCTACHNPHHAQRDAHTEGYRGSVVSLPSTHGDLSTWQLWGDGAGETMDQYTTYQAPYATYDPETEPPVFEPDSSTTQDGSNLTDYVTFCTDCHDNSNDIDSNVLERPLNKFDWGTEKHGGGDATNDEAKDGDQFIDFIDVKAPYDQDTRYVLACTDCHEPHGSPNIFLIRERVNNGDVTVLTGEDVGPDQKEWREWLYLCRRCHNDLQGGEHIHSPAIQNGVQCFYCHNMHGGFGMYRPCAACHYHGNTEIPAVPGDDRYPAFQYNSGEHLF